MSASKLFIALDLPSLDEARDLIDILDGLPLAFKIGLQLLPIGGAALTDEIKNKGHDVFLDYKLHDIGATVEKATRSIATLGGDYLTVHAHPDVMAAAHAGRNGRNLKILGVTVLTSLDQNALNLIGYDMTAAELVMRRVQQAQDAGIDGVVASPQEAAMIRQNVPDDFLIVTPGVRPHGSDTGDQKRVATPAQAMSNGATHIVVGRPITQASDPRAVAKAILSELN